MFSKLKIPIIIVVTAVMTQLAGYAAHAAMPNAFLPAGTTRYAFVSTAAQASTTSMSFVSLPGLSTSITVPAGKHADVFILFCGDMITESFTVVRALVGGSRGAPIEMLVREPSASPLGGGETGCANFLKKDVAAGTHTVAMQWRGAGGVAGAYQTIWDRSMVVITNIR
jgi:hypothetical protein